MKHAVIIPTFNAEQFIVRALESLRAQTLSPEEVIVIDDGSTDDTLRLIKAWASENKLPLVVEQITNSGAGAARNRALEQVTAEWVSFLDADDEWAPDKLARVEAAVSSSHQVEFVHTDRVYILPSGDTLDSGFQAGRMVDPQYLCSGFTIKTSTVSIARAFLSRTNLKFGTESTSEDYALFWRTVIRARAIRYIDEPLTVVHERQGSLTRSDNESALILDNIGVLAAIIKEEPQHSEEAVKAVRALSLLRYRLAQQVFMGDAFSPVAFMRNTARLSRSIGKGELLKVLASVALSKPRRRSGTTAA